MPWSSSKKILKGLSSPFYAFKQGIESIRRLVSDRLPYRVAQYVKDNGNKRIESITLYRQPIMSIIKKLLTILTLGKWDQAQSKLGYDDLMHLYAVIQFADNTRAILEKNQDIQISPDIQSKGSGGESMPVDMKGRQPTLNDLLANTKKLMGSDRFYGYNFRSNNCQDFLLAVLRANRFDSPQTTAFIKQNVADLVKTLPPDVSIMATGATKAASYVNRVLQAMGFKGYEEGGLVF